MNDYIKREDALKALSEIAVFTDVAEDVVNDIPSADVEPVRQGYWIRESVGSDNSSEGYFKISMAECSECGTCVMGKPNYCPNCGARMRMTKEQYESHVGDIYEDGENDE